MKVMTFLQYSYMAIMWYMGFTKHDSTLLVAAGLFAIAAELSKGR